MELTASILILGAGFLAGAAWTKFRVRAMTGDPLLKPWLRWMAKIPTWVP
jgi:hypothetical protein